MAFLGATQAQEPLAAKWAVGLRVEGATTASVDGALASGAVVRTHALRGTWQLLAAADVRWVVDLVGAGQLRKAARRERELGLDPPTQRRSRAVLERALRDGAHLKREELRSALEDAGVSTKGPRLSHLLWRAELEGVVRGGAPRDGQPTWTALAPQGPHAARRVREEALAELALRYFRSRGPATVDDFTWWSGLPPAEARAAHAAVRPGLDFAARGEEQVWFGELPAARPGPAAQLLPAFDEYLIGYRDRDDVLDPKHVRRINSGGGLLFPCVLLRGAVVGVWRRELKRGEVHLEVAPFERLAPGDREAVGEAAGRYARFLGLSLRLDLVKRVAREAQT